MQSSDLLFGFIVMAVIMFGPFFLKCIKESIKEVSQNTSTEYQIQNGFVRDTIIDNFLKLRDTHVGLCTYFINMIKLNATDEDISYVLEEMEYIRLNCNYVDKIDTILFPIAIDLKDGIKLYEHFNAKIQECEKLVNVPRGYAYMAWAITLIAHIDAGLNAYGAMLWGELKRGFNLYEKRTGKTWVQIPRF